MLGYLFEVGPNTWAGMGEAPISHAEIQAWQHNTGIALSAWEARTLRRLSVAYVDQLHKSRDPQCPAPWVPAVIEETARDSVHRRLKSLFSSLAANPPRKSTKRHARRNN